MFQPSLQNEMLPFECFCKRQKCVISRIMYHNHHFYNLCPVTFTLHVSCWRQCVNICSVKSFLTRGLVIFWSRTFPNPNPWCSLCPNLTSKQTQHWTCHLPGLLFPSNVKMAASGCVTSLKNNPCKPAPICLFK